MKSCFSIAVTVLALVVMIASTAVSADEKCLGSCSDQCDRMKGFCESGGAFGDFCGHQFVYCNKICKLTCACGDSCKGTCGEDYTACTSGHSDDALNEYTCSFTQSNCENTCEVDCFFQIFAGIVQPLRHEVVNNAS